MMQDIDGRWSMDVVCVHDIEFSGAGVVHKKETMARKYGTIQKKDSLLRQFSFRI